MGNYYVHGGKIHTFSKSGTVDAMLVIGDRVAMVGNENNIEPYLPSGTAKIDLKGRTVFPGFHDSHIHLMMYSVSRKQTDLMGIETVDEALQIIKEVSSLAKPGQWITGRGWDKSLWVHFPSKGQLDKVAPNNPVVLSSKCGHSTWVNSMAFKEAGITKDTVAPEGGGILKDQNGELLGILQDTASRLVRKFIPPVSPDFALEATADCIPKLWRMGITCVHTPDQTPLFGMARKLRIERNLPLRVAYMPPFDSLSLLESYGISQGYGNDWVWTAQIKLFKDGSLGASSALMFEPFEGTEDNFGLAVISHEDMLSKVEQAVGAGFGTCVHAIGDKAVSDMLDVFETHRAKTLEAGVRHRMEHAQIIRPQDIERFAKLDIIASIQPAHIVADRYMSDRELGKRSEMAFPLVSLLNAGVPMAFGSDAPVDTPDPIYGIHCAVNRNLPGESVDKSWYPGQRISVEDAIRAYTVDAAFAAGKEDVIGDLGEGKYADFVILSQDLLEIDPLEIGSTKVEGVCIGGNFVILPD